MSQQPPHGEQPTDQSSWGQRPLPPYGQPPQNWSAMPHPLPSYSQQPQPQQPFQYATGYESVQLEGNARKKPGKKRRFLLLLLLIVVVLIGGIGSVFWFVLPNFFPTNITIVWHASSSTFTAQDQQAIQSAWKTLLVAAHSGNIAGHQFTIIDAQRRGDWAIFSANEQMNANALPISSEPLFFIAHRNGSTWAVWIPSSSGFCAQLKQLPDALLGQGDKHYFLGCYQ